MTAIDRGFSFNPMELEIELRRKQAPEQESAPDLLLYETVDPAAILEYELGKIPEVPLRFSQPYEVEDQHLGGVPLEQRSIILVPLRDNAWYALGIDSCRYPLSRLPDRFEFDEKYGVVPPHEDGILFEGIFRSPVEHEVSEGFTGPIYMASHLDLAMMIAAGSSWRDHLRPNGEPLNPKQFPKPPSYLSRQAHHAAGMIPLLGDFVASSRPIALK